MKKSAVVSILIVLALLLFSSSIYVVNEDEVAVTKTLGRIVAVVVSPGEEGIVKENLGNTQLANIRITDQKGLHFKIPFFQTVEKYTAKYLTYTSLPQKVNTADSRRVEVQMYAQYRVIDPATFNKIVVTKSEANQRMDDDVYPTIINSVNKLEFNDFFDQEILENLLDKEQEQLNERMVKQFGLYVSDIGISRKTFPLTNISTIEEKMTKEIEKESAQSIAEGDSIYNKKIALVDAAKAQVLANAVEVAAVIKADADAEAIRTYQEALSVDLEFYRFITRMDIYTNISGSTIFLDKENPVFSYLNDLKYEEGATSTTAPTE